MAFNFWVGDLEYILIKLINQKYSPYKGNNWQKEPTIVECRCFEWRRRATTQTLFCIHWHSSFFLRKRRSDLIKAETFISILFHFQNQEILEHTHCSLIIYGVSQLQHNSQAHFCRVLSYTLSRRWRWWHKRIGRRLSSYEEKWRWVNQ